RRPTEMDALTTPLDPLARAVLQGVLGGLWQGVALAAAAALLLRLPVRTSAATRHAVWWAALALLVVLQAAGIAEALGPGPASPATAAAAPAGGVAASTWTLPAPPAPWPLLLLALLLAGAALRLAGVVAGLGALRRLKHRAL